MPVKCADTIAHLIIEEIFPRYGAPLEIVTDNGSENCNKTVRESLQALNVRHVKTSLYHPNSNGKTERFHRVLNDILAKKLRDNVSTWDLHLNQTLAAIRFNVSASTKFSPFFLLYNRDVVLPLDNILKPRRIGWLVGCFGFNGPLRQYFSLYRAVSQREGERAEKG